MGAYYSKSVRKKHDEGLRCHALPMRLRLGPMSTHNLRGDINRRLGPLVLLHFYEKLQNYGKSLSRHSRSLLCMPDMDCQNI